MAIDSLHSTLMRRGRAPPISPISRAPPAPGSFGRSPNARPPPARRAERLAAVLPGPDACCTQQCGAAPAVGGTCLARLTPPRAQPAVEPPAAQTQAQERTRLEERSGLSGRRRPQLLPQTPWWADRQRRRRRRRRRRCAVRRARSRPPSAGASADSCGRVTSASRDDAKVS